MQQMTVQEKVGQMFTIGFHGLEAPDYLLEWLAQGRAGGVILFARNIDTPEQVARLTASLHKAAKYPLLIGIDQEGGTVARLRKGFSESPGAMALAAASDEQTARTERVSAVLGEEMCAIGINWDYAPAVDLLYSAENPTMGTRSFGIDPEQVSSFAEAAVEGFQRAGVAACAKHFPGLGETAIDTHLALPRLTVSEAQLLNRDLMPYRAAIDAGIASIMTTHTIIETLDPDYPATLSPVIIQRLLRDELGFDGVVTTDCMEMKAIADHYGVGESAILAAKAGVDVILVSHTPEMQAQAYESLLQAVMNGDVSEEIIDAASARVEKLKSQFAITAAPDLEVIRHPDHLAIMEEAARAGTVLLYGEIPSLHGRVLAVEFASVLESGIVEMGGQTGFAQRLRERLPAIEIHSLPGGDLEAALAEQLTASARAADWVIVATRNAAWNTQQCAFAEAMLQNAQNSILLCLRTPFDAPVLPRASAALCTCGDSAPSLDAAIDVLMGEFIPNGRLSIPVALP